MRYSILALVQIIKVNIVEHIVKVKLDEVFIGIEL